MLDQAQKEEYKKIYSSYAFTKDEQKEANDSINELIKNFAKKIEVKPAILKKALDFKYKRHETGEDLLAEITQISMEAELEN